MAILISYHFNVAKPKFQQLSKLSLLVLLGEKREKLNLSYKTVSIQSSALIVKKIEQTALTVKCIVKNLVNWANNAECKPTELSDLCLHCQPKYFYSNFWDHYGISKAGAPGVR